VGELKILETIFVVLREKIAQDESMDNYTKINKADATQSPSENGSDAEQNSPKVNITVNVKSFYHSKRMKDIRVRVNGHEVLIPVSESVYVHFQEQFLGAPRSQPKHKRRTTLMKISEAAYLKGRQDEREIKSLAA